MQIIREDALARLNWKKQCLIKVWMIWERTFNRVFHVRPIDKNNEFLSVRVRKYRGKAIELADGEFIRHGDLIAELHLNNEVLLTMQTNARSSVQLAIQMIRATASLMPRILRLIRTEPRYGNVKGVYGISLIHRGAEQFGFTILDLPKGLFASATRVYLRSLLFIIHPQGKQRLKTKTELLVPKIIAISTKELMRRYENESN
ncbi:YkoP family protein [Aneurinibacillus terranovensis]|uniref:YkoP family protein n=1 Tax=Aneurinibacillus terranovensis TaxID=278991 RepID=UPI0003F54D4B|nr:hypothetical protein [Aneurinibacillus terranovensis]